MLVWAYSSSVGHSQCGVRVQSDGHKDFQPFDSNDCNCICQPAFISMLELFGLYNYCLHVRYISYLTFSIAMNGKID